MPGRTHPSPWRSASDHGDPELDALLEHLKRLRGVDFTGYKRSTVARRVTRRLEAIGCSGYDAYADVIEQDPVELDRLIDSVLINVTAFLRDAEAWEQLSRTVLPALTAEGTAPIRVWSAGCATGEETYTIAMLLAEALGEEAYLQRVKIYATDIDEAALAVARAGVYSAQQVRPLAAGLRDRYFAHRDGSYAFRKELRGRIIFGRNDLVRDAPISRIDLLLCRNTFIYFNAATQADVLRRFNFALRPTGFLFAGKSEMLITHSRFFAPHDLKWRIFRSVEVRREREAGAGLGAGATRRAATEAIARRAFEEAPVPQVVLDDRGGVRLVNRAAHRLLEGEPDAGAQLAGDPGVAGLVREARERRRPAGPRRVPVHAGVAEVLAVPLIELGRVAGVALQLRDVTLAAALDRARGAAASAPDACAETTPAVAFARLERVLGAARVAVVSLDRTGVVTRWDRRAADLLGRPATAAVGRHLDALGTVLPPWSSLVRGTSPAVSETRAGPARLIVRAQGTPGGADLLITRRGLSADPVTAAPVRGGPAT